MPLCSRTRRFLISTSQGRLLAGNSEAAVRMGFIDALQLFAYYSAAHRTYSRAGGGHEDVFQNKLSDLRLRAGTDLTPGRVLDGAVPLPALNVPDLSRQKVYTVLNLEYLNGLVDADSPLKRVGLPTGGQRRSGYFEQRWQRVRPNRRWFLLNRHLGRPLVWFVTEEAVITARSWKAQHPDQSEADAFKIVLGLSHPPRTWLVLLHIPGSAVQAAGHYRPLFCDAVKHPHFMARSSDPDAPVGQWGQTAHLGLLMGHRQRFDGAAERVAKVIVPDPKKKAPRIYVDLLGEVSDHYRSEDVRDPLADRVWARRRLD